MTVFRGPAMIPRRHALAFILAALFFLTAAQAEEGPATPKVKVEITGLQGDLLENTRASLGLLRNANDPKLSDALIQTLYQRAETEIHRALEPFGRYRPELHSNLRPPTTEGQPWVAEFQVDPGLPLLITELDLQLGAAAPALAGAFPLSSGDPLDHRQYKKSKQELLRRARAAGYLKAKLTLHRIEIDLEAYQAAVRIHLDPGPLHRFCGLTFEQEGFREDYLRAFVPMKKGDPYTQDSEAELRRALVASGHFRRVEIERLDIDRLLRGLPAGTPRGPQTQPLSGPIRLGHRHRIRPALRLDPAQPVE